MEDEEQKEIIEQLIKKLNEDKIQKMIKYLEKIKEVD